MFSLKFTTRSFASQKLPAATECTKPEVIYESRKSMPTGACQHFVLSLSTTVREVRVKCFFGDASFRGVVSTRPLVSFSDFCLFRCRLENFGLIILLPSVARIIKFRLVVLMKINFNCH